MIFSIFFEAIIVYKQDLQDLINSDGQTMSNDWLLFPAMVQNFFSAKW